MDILQLYLFDRNQKYTDSFSPKRIRKERERISQQLTRARAARVPATLTLDEWFAILNYYDGLCAYCKEVPFQSIDHIYPLRKGGGTTADNVVPACTLCNVMKNSKIAYKIAGKLIIDFDS